MSISPVARPETGRPVGPPRRVRHQAREAVAVMAFSVAMSLAFAVLLLVIGLVGSRG